MTSATTISGLVSRHVRPGEASFLGKLTRYALRSWLLMRTREAPVYRSPSGDELAQIEAGFWQLGMPCNDLQLDPAEFEEFVQRFRFPPNYHGGVDGGVYAEKLLEHFVAWKLLSLGHIDAGRYVDIAACSSPWAKLLRETGVDAYAIDLDIDAAYSALPYYRQEDATHSTFASGSITGASLQCAFEMFSGDQDRDLIAELGRILVPGGRAVISPLYTHTQPCYYQTPEFFDTTKGDAGAAAYIRRDTWGVPASRKYSPETLRTRVWDVARNHGLHPQLMALRNKATFGAGIYLHFVLVLDKNAESAT